MTSAIIRGRNQTVVVGAGPAGVGAAVWLRRNGADVLLLDEQGLGGYLNNMPFEVGLDHPLGTGPELVDHMARQLEEAELELTVAEALGVTVQDGGLELETTVGTTTCEALVAATGAREWSVDVAGVETYRGRGVSTCVGCDAPLFAGKLVLLVGRGAYLPHELSLLAEYASFVTVLAAEPPALPDADNVEYLPGWRLRSIVGGDVVGFAKIESGDGARRNLEVAGVMFAGVGAPNSDWIRAGVDTAEDGAILTDDQRAASVAGIFAVGAVRDAAPEDVASVAAEGNDIPTITDWSNKR